MYFLYSISGSYFFYLEAKLALFNKFQFFLSGLFFRKKTFLFLMKHFVYAQTPLR